MPDRMSDVIVLLPGIMGSELHREGRVVWGWSGRALVGNLMSAGRGAVADLTPRSPTGDDGVVAVRLLPDLHLIPGFWKIDGYGTVAQYIGSEFDVTANENFFEFPYDWRLDNRASARRLKARTDDWLHRWRARGNGQARLILIAHSMGGLVARYFLEVLEGWRDTRALITFGTPFRGSLNAVDAIANGVDVLGRIDVTSLVRSLDSVHQLLPVYPCLRSEPGGPLRRIGEIGLPNADPARVADAMAFHEEIRRAVAAHRQDQLYRDHGYRIHPIVGYRQTTHQCGLVREGAVELGPEIEGNALGGDGTVPRPAAFPLEQDDGTSAMFASTKHSRLQNAAAVLDHLGGLMSSLDLPLGTFRAAIPRRVQVSLDLDDACRLDEPAVVRARATRGGVTLGAALVEVESDREVERLPMRPEADGWHRVEFRCPRAGAYRVFVSGDHDEVEPASDVFEAVAVA